MAQKSRSDHLEESDRAGRVIMLEQASLLIRAAMREQRNKDVVLNMLYNEIVELKEGLVSCKSI